ncbi:MAG: Gfo/Idh/MocA family oxidoreductase [Firmicutes bacterium]|nr:Gfo/Idh/MocA family oxidoreductase [Bacillota bacterium]MDD4264306.1 Gfo/Idh/MocA family oxidoreductase [Bacillota bacterium]MDD4694473.1 Gfo/Idh/MocA family oxidoreductase [Bacillota bacterium]
MKVRIGVVGNGAIAKYRHLPEYASRDDVEIVALCDIIKAKAEKLALRYDVKKVYTDYKQMIEKEKLDAVSVCTPNYLHSEITIYALKHGLNVLVEKPMATSMAEANEMIETARKNNLVLMVGQNQRLAPMHVLAKKILESGMMGKVNTFRTVFGHGGPEHWSQTGKWFFDKKQAFAGSLADLGVHKVDLVQFILGDIDQVACFTDTLEKKECTVDDNAVAILHMENGIMGTVETSWTYKPIEENGTVFFCEKGTLKMAVEPDAPLVAYFAEPGRGRCVFEVPQIQTNEDGGQFSTGVIDGFIETINGTRENPVSGEEGRKALRAILACIESAASNRKVLVEEVN